MATIPTGFDRFIFLWAAEQKISSSFVREFSDGRKHCARTFFDIKPLINSVGFVGEYPNADPRGAL
jgi:hypothetical protein